MIPSAVEPLVSVQVGQTVAAGQVGQTVAGGQEGVETDGQQLSHAVLLQPLGQELCPAANPASKISWHSANAHSLSIRLHNTTKIYLKNIKLSFIIDD